MDPIKVNAVGSADRTVSEELSNEPHSSKHKATVEKNLKVNNNLIMMMHEPKD